MSKTTKWINILLAVSLTTILSACSFETKEPEKQFDAPVKINIFISDLGQPVPVGDPMNDPTIKYLAQKTNTNLDLDFVPNSQYDKQLRVRIASGELPDIIQGWGINGDLLRNDQLLPLNDLIEQYAPNLKKVIPQAAWDGVTIDDNIFAVPEAPQGDSPESRVIFVRKDWMDKVGIKEVPTTTDEFLTMLRAFRDRDPNGNGIMDEIPLSAREQLSWLDNILGMFGVNTYGTMLYHNEIIPQYASPNMKSALGFIKLLMEEKLLDNEFMFNIRSVWEQKIQNDLVGVWVHSPNLAWDWQQRLNSSIPNAKPDVVAIPTPKAPGVKEVGFGKKPYERTFYITRAAKDPVAAIKWLDWLVTQEGQEFVQFGVPGVTYTKDNGRLNYNRQKDMDGNSANWRPLVFNLAGFNEEIIRIQTGSDEGVAKLKAAYEVGKKEGITNPIFGVTGIQSELREIGDINTPSAMFIEAAALIVFNEKPLDYFDEFVQNWRTLGGDKLIKTATDVYNKNRKE